MIYLLGCFWCIWRTYSNNILHFIDSFLRSRSSTDHEATAMIKTQFMSLWDGIITDPNCQIMIIGATNRPQDVDAAILRRMPCQFKIGKPVINFINFYWSSVSTIFLLDVGIFLEGGIFCFSLHYWHLIREYLFLSLLYKEYLKICKYI